MVYGYLSIGTLKNCSHSYYTEKSTFVKGRCKTFFYYSEKKQNSSYYIYKVTAKKQSIFFDLLGVFRQTYSLNTDYLLVTRMLF